MRPTQAHPIPSSGSRTRLASCYRPGIPGIFWTHSTVVKKIGKGSEDVERVTLGGWESGYFAQHSLRLNPRNPNFLVVRTEGQILQVISAANHGPASDWLRRRCGILAHLNFSSLVAALMAQETSREGLRGYSLAMEKSWKNLGMPQKIPNTYCDHLYHERLWSSNCQ